jgi:hypothetical protein
MKRLGLFIHGVFEGVGTALGAATVVLVLKYTGLFDFIEVYIISGGIPQ